MKRFLLLFCTVVLFYSIMIVPVFAAEDYSFSQAYPEDDTFFYAPEMLPSGKYIFSFVFSDLTFTSEPFVIEYEIDDSDADCIYYETPYYEFSLPDGTCLSVQHTVYTTSEMSGTDGCLQLYIEGYDYVVDGSQIITFTPVEPDSIVFINGVLQFFGGVGDWFVNQLSAATSLFWNAASGELTFLGILAVAGLAFSVVFLLIGIIQRFLRFRG